MESIADCSHRTSIIEQTYTFKWILKHLSKLEFPNELRSLEFHVDKGDSKWYASFFNNSDSSGTLKLLRKPSTTALRIACEVVIVDCNGKLYYEDKQRKTYYNTSGNASSLSFVKIEPTILNELKSESNDSCHIIFTIKFYKTKKGALYEIPSQQKCKEKLKKKFCSNFWKIFESKIGTDLTLQIKGEKIEAHKTVLIAQSPVFAKMFQMPMSESEKNTVVIDDISKPAMMELIKYIYSEAGFGYSFDMAMELYYAADKYELFELREFCGKNLLSLMEEENAGRLLEMADKHKDDYLKNKVMSFINSNVKSCLKKAWWSEFTCKKTELVEELMKFIK